jgi:ribosomal protein S12 methylthiotransferase accessory factor
VEEPMSQQMTIRFPGDKKVYADYNGFEIRTDQNRDNGGEASAPEPFDLFFASLGTCAGHYVKSFCARRKIPADEIRLVQSWTRDENRKLKEIRIEIHVPAGFPAKYHAALVRAAGQCSVKRVLDTPPSVETVVAVVD